MQCRMAGGRTRRSRGIARPRVRRCRDLRPIRCAFLATTVAPCLLGAPMIGGSADLLGLASVKILAIVLGSCQIQDVGQTDSADAVGCTMLWLSTDPPDRPELIHVCGGRCESSWRVGADGTCSSARASQRQYERDGWWLTNVCRRRRPRSRAVQAATFPERTRPTRSSVS